MDMRLGLGWVRGETLYCNEMSVMSVQGGVER